MLDAPNLTASQGEDQKKLDVISNEVFSNCLRQCGRTGIIASEEDQPVRAAPAVVACCGWCMAGQHFRRWMRTGNGCSVLEHCCWPAVAAASGRCLLTRPTFPLPQVAVEETFSGEYVVVFDPLDGSSNIDAGAPQSLLGLERVQLGDLEVSDYLTPA